VNAPPLEEGDRASQNTAQEPGPRDPLLSSLESFNKKLRDLFQFLTVWGNPLKDSSAIFDITDALLESSTDP